MKIKKSQIEKIIQEELSKMALEEGEFGDMAKGALGGLKTVGREFIKGFMGNMPEDNPFSKGVYKAFGSTLVPAIDKNFSEVLDRLEELKNHDEGKKLTSARTKADGSPLPDQPMSIDEFDEFLKEDVLPMWLKMTAVFRGPEAQQRQEQGDSDEAPEEETLAEAIRRGIREELQRRSIS